jgi:hypothetical protein
VDVPAFLFALRLVEWPETEALVMRLLIVVYEELKHERQGRILTKLDIRAFFFSKFYRENLFH